ncbi:MAG: glycosyltransferase [Paucibacter sp.]|nr:glycosyltransferase [Roseateles sp.]
MKISIITVAYNSGRTIADTLRSVALQSHPDVEHIVIDGASTDDTMEQVRQHGAHVAKLVSEPDRGIYDAMNKGLALASGDFVGCLNADDMLAGPDTLARMAQRMSEADMIYGDLVYVDAEQTDRVVRHWNSGPYEASRLRFGWMPPHPTFYFRRSALPDIRFDLRYRIAADYDFMVRSLQGSPRVAYLPEVLVRMRNGGASNHSLKAMLKKSSEDLDVIRRHKLGGVLTLASKNLRKLPQFLMKS